MADDETLPGITGTQDILEEMRRQERHPLTGRAFPHAPYYKPDNPDIRDAPPPTKVMGTPYEQVFDQPVPRVDTTAPRWKQQIGRFTLSPQGEQFSTLASFLGPRAPVLPLRPRSLIQRLDAVPMPPKRQFLPGDFEFSAKPLEGMGRDPPLEMAVRFPSDFSDRNRVSQWNGIFGIMNPASSANRHARIHVSQIPDELQGQGVGVNMYERFLREAFARGAQSVRSDSSLSPYSTSMYELALPQRGYRIERNPSAEKRNRPGEGVGGIDYGWRGYPYVYEVYPPDPLKRGGRVRARFADGGVPGLYVSGRQGSEQDQAVADDLMQRDPYERALGMAERGNRRVMDWEEPLGFPGSAFLPMLLRMPMSAPSARPAPSVDALGPDTAALLRQYDLARGANPTPWGGRFVRDLPALHAPNRWHRSYGEEINPVMLPGGSNSHVGWADEFKGGKIFQGMTYPELRFNRDYFTSDRAKATYGGRSNNQRFLDQTLRDLDAEMARRRGQFDVVGPSKTEPLPPGQLPSDPYLDALIDQQWNSMVRKGGPPSMPPKLTPLEGGQPPRPQLDLDKINEYAAVHKRLDSLLRSLPPEVQRTAIWPPPPDRAGAEAWFLRGENKSYIEYLSRLLGESTKKPPE